MSSPRASLWRSSVLFLLAVWPTWVVDLPPLQDLPNHLAAAVVQANPAAYPELESNGFLKTNSALFVFLHLLGGPLGLRLAAKLFVTLTLAVGAVCYPRAVARLGGETKVHSATFLLWPMVHNWFVAMGMLDYALAVPLSLETLVWLSAFRSSSRWTHALVAAALAVVVWYAHAFGVVMLGLLVLLECVAQWRREPPRSVRLLLPLAPALALTAASALTLMRSESHAGVLGTEFRGLLPLVYAAWAEWLWSLTKWTSISIVVAGALVYFGARRLRERPAFFSPLALCALALLFFALPFYTHRWFYVGSRVLPFVWMACVLRVPDELPAFLRGVLAAAAALWSAGLGVEYVQNAREWASFCRGEEAVPRGARLLPLIFDRKGPYGDNTWPMLHAWGLYVVDKHTSAPLVFAHSRSFPVTYAKEPPARLHPFELEKFSQTMRSSKTYCEELRAHGLLVGAEDCAASYRDAWQRFWVDASPRFDRVLMYEPSDEVRASLLPSFRIVYDRAGVVVIAP